MLNDAIILFGFAAFIPFTYLFKACVIFWPVGDGVKSGADAGGMCLVLVYVLMLTMIVVIQYILKCFSTFR